MSLRATACRLGRVGEEARFVQVVIDKMNDLFGAESFAESQVREFVLGLVQQLLTYPDLV